MRCTAMACTGGWVIPDVCRDFYEKLADFDFHVCKKGLGNVVGVASDLRRMPVDTSAVEEHMLEEGEIPFMK